MKKVYTEIGFGNETFLNTEFEEGESEYRVPRFVLPEKINGLYIRIWILKKVYIFSTNNIFKIGTKDRNKFKILLGVSGENI